jgi:hypothetical protein
MTIHGSRRIFLYSFIEEYSRELFNLNRRYDPFYHILNPQTLCTEERLTALDIMRRMIVGSIITFNVENFINEDDEIGWFASNSSQ